LLLAPEFLLLPSIHCSLLIAHKKIELSGSDTDKEGNTGTAVEYDERICLNFSVLVAKSQKNILKK